MNLKILLLQSLLIFSCPVNAQTNPLKSTKHGLDMMLRDLPKEELLEEMRFEHGKDDTISVVRFDHVGPNLYPLIISSELPLATDSLGILSFKLKRDTLYNFLKMVDNVTSKSNSRKLDQILIRVTYRFNGRMEQYHITNARIVTGFLKAIERKLIANKDDQTLDKFYLFIARMKLQRVDNEKRVWIY